MAYTGQQNKPGKIGHVTTVLYQDKNIGIDGKIYQLLDARVNRVRQDNPQLGDEVEYKISSSKDLSEKGKISFFAIKKRAGTDGVQQPVTQTAPVTQVTHTPPDTQDIQAEYVSKDQMKVTLKDCVGEEQIFRADLDVIKMLAKADSPVQPGKKYKVRLVKQDQEWVVTKIGPFDESFGEKPFRTGKEILQQNLDEKKAETAQAEAALAQINKENAEGDARIAENKEHLKTLIEGQKPMSTSEPTKEPEKSPQNAAVAVPDTILPATGGVELGIHVNLGNYSSFDLKVTGINGDHARQLLAQEAAPTIALVKKIVTDASKGY